MSRLRTVLLIFALVAAQLTFAPPGAAYVLNYIVADMRQPPSIAGNTACPQRMRLDISSPGHISRQWSTSLGTNPATILTSDQTSAGRLNEIEVTITQSFAAWTTVAGSALTAGSLSSLARTSIPAACAADGVNSLCMNQNDAAFATGVLGFTRLITADAVGERAGPAAPLSTFVGEILDADILLRPADPTVKFATPAALSANPAAYDLASVITHELGHVFGFGHSAIWRAKMFPFVPSPGTFTGSRATLQSPDAPLADDDRSALRALYPDVFGNTYIGSISGRILPANLLALSGQSAGSSGIFAAQVVAVDASTGAVAGASLSGWSCSSPGPPVFNGFYRIEGLSVGPAQTYQLYAEPLDGPVPATSSLGQTILCRNTLTDPGWPAQFACSTPALPPPFSTTMRPGP